VCRTPERVGCPGARTRQADCHPIVGPDDPHPIVGPDDPHPIVGPDDPHPIVAHASAARTTSTFAAHARQKSDASPYRSKRATTSSRRSVISASWAERQMGIPHWRS